MLFPRESDVAASKGQQCGAFAARQVIRENWWACAGDTNGDFQILMSYNLWTQKYRGIVNMHGHQQDLAAMD